MSRDNHEKLKKIIHHHDYLYHTLDKPEISDFEYDRLFSELLKIEAEASSRDNLDLSDSPTQRAGSQVLAVFQKVPHRKPMLSLSNTYSPEELREWNQRLVNLLGEDSEFEFFAEPKFDGLAIELIYEYGLLVRALTRGDGVVGEDVTHNVKTIRNVPLRLLTSTPPALVEIRGEIVMEKEDFLRLNEQQESSGLEGFANPRNAAAGTLRQLDSRIAASRKLKLFAHGLGDSNCDWDSHFEMLTQFKSWGLTTTPHFKVCQSIEEVIQFYNQVASLRHKLPFDIDGIVVKLNPFRLQRKAGLVARSPRWAVAAKYPPEQAQTKVKEIIVQVGRTGVLTPVAILQPVFVGGVTITHATLHNQDELAKKDVRQGDTVIVQRAGDVIPEVVEVIKTLRPGNSAPFEFPVKCPSCNSAISREPEEVAFRCTNRHCVAQLKESLKHFVSRRAMNVEKCGEKLIEALVDRGLLTDFSDLYRLTKEQIAELPKQGEKSSQNVTQSIEKSKKVTFARFVYALGIRFVGEQTARSLADHFDSDFNRLIRASEAELIEINDIGPRVAGQIFLWFQDEKNLQMIHNLFALGITLDTPQKIKNSERLAGKSFLVTGTLPVSREEAHELIRSHGGQIVSSVSAKLGYLVCGEKPGSKREKAEKLSIPIISWDDLLTMIGETN